MKRLLAIVGLALCLASCGGDDDDDDGAGAGTSGATCPSNSSLTYQTFGQAFMGKYCTPCHASGLSGAARQGAPSDHNFDALSDIRATEQGHIDEVSAAGDKKVNKAMPPSNFATQPSEAERRQLGEWLACGMP
jgi:uncharacterized membrane protein